MNTKDKDRLIEELRKIIAEQKSVIEGLMRRIEELEHKKNSKNSSISPSQDPHRKRQKSLRQKSGKKPGGQPGHKGITKMMVSDPAQIIDHKPGYCRHCGTEVQDIELAGRRQVVDIPRIAPEYIEHRIYQSKCTCCGKNTTSDYPKGVSGNVSYGPNIEALAVYLNVRQYMPYQRMQEYFDQLTGIRMSQGTLVNLINRSALKSKGIYQEIKKKITKAHWLGSDETGCKVNGKKYWFWTWQNDEMTYITSSQSRGFVTVQDQFPKGLKHSIIVSDCLAAQLKQDCATHQICLAHLYRDLNYLIEKDQEAWSSELKSLMEDACRLKNEIDYSSFDQYSKQILDMESKLHRLLQHPMEYSWVYQKQLKKRLVKNKDYIFTFLYHKDVPPDNNSSERAIRNVKVKQKISGQFKSLNSAHAFATIRSVIDTCIKQNVQVLPTLQNLALCTC